MKQVYWFIWLLQALACAVFAQLPQDSTTLAAPEARSSAAGSVILIESSSAETANNVIHIATDSATKAANASATPTDSLQKPESNPYNIPDELMPLWDSLSIKQKAAQMVMVYLSPAKFLIQNEFGAVLVMKSHLKDPESFKQKIKTANDSLRIPLLVATDQEGGRVNRLSGISEKWKTAPSAKEMRQMETDSIEAIAQSIGSELHELGINLNLAPVLDPDHDYRKKRSFIEESHRSWGSNENREEKVRAFVKGMQESGIACVSKHFPGYDSWTNSDHQIAVSSTPKPQMSENYRFFRNLADVIPVTMMSSVRFVRVSNRPAVFEPKIIRMARKMNPETVILTDDLWGVSLRAWVSGTERVTSKNYPRKDFKKLIRTALLAGNDMFMITYPAKAVEMINYLDAMAKYNDTYRQRIEESAARILKLKFRIGLLNSSLPSAPALPQNDSEQVSESQPQP